MKEDKTPKQPGEGPIAARIIPKITSLLKNFPPGKLLDVGAGRGNPANRFKNMGCEVYACDIQDVLQYKGIKWSKVDLNLGVLPYDNNSFDYVTCTEVLEHLENPRAIMREVARVVKKGGAIILTTPHVLSLPQRLYYLLTGRFLHFPKDYGLYGHITPVSLFTIRDELEKCHMKIDKIVYDRGFIQGIRVKMPANFWFGDHIIIRAIKQ